MSDVVRTDLRGVKNELDSCALVVTDSNIKALYPELTVGAFVIPAGEKSKSPDVLFSILKEMSVRSLGRSDRIAALGGGVVGDVTGLAAALYMRGIEWISIPTSLLALVDSGLGGKTAIDFCGEKNLVGAFHAPVRVVMNHGFTDTLEKRELICGVGEIIKTSLLTKKSCGMLFENADALLRFDADTLHDFIDVCVDIKSHVVNMDFKDNGIRHVLNVGHTVGHALESSDGFKLTHGEYVLKGIMTECAMFRDAIADDKFYGDIINLIAKSVKPPKTSGNSVLRYALRDKKNNGRITVMLPIAAGDIAEIETDGTEFLSRYDRAVKELKSL